MRYYTINNTKLPSVTTIISQNPDKKHAIQKWRKNHPNPNTYTKIWQKTGDCMHHRILNPLSHKPLPPPNLSTLPRKHLPKITANAETAETMWHDLDLTITPGPFIEHQLHHTLQNNTGYAGTADFIGYINNKLTIMDLKSNPRATQYPDAKKQIAAYHNAATHLNKLPNPTHGLIISLCGDPERNPNLKPRLKWLTTKDLKKHYQNFLTDLNHFYNTTPTNRRNGVKER